MPTSIVKVMTEAPEAVTDRRRFKRLYVCIFTNIIVQDLTCYDIIYYFLHNSYQTMHTRG